jgi:(heptosyl)LPS beta-1,4-glucosyltransferase
MLSVAIITKNEEGRLPACLKSLDFADDILVVDSGSTDSTIQVAQSFGTRVMIEPWRGFSLQKQFAVDHCVHDWVLILDADEKVPEATALAIERELSSCSPNVSAYGFRRKNYLHGRWMKHCGWWPDRIVRLVDRRQGRFDGRDVHEKWVTRRSVKSLNDVIEHRSFACFSDLTEKMERYSTLASEEMFRKGLSASAFAPASHGLWMFFRTYLLELGILEGFDGFVISAMNAGGSFLKYAKLREKREQANAGIRTR